MIILFLRLWLVGAWIAVANGFSRLSAVIIDPHPNAAFLDAVLNARSALPIAYPIHVITNSVYWSVFDSLFHLNVHVKKDFAVPLTFVAYSNLLADCDFWRSFQSLNILVFQADSRFCARSARSIDYFLELDVDWVGAPWGAEMQWRPLASAGSLVGNGGFSLRSRSAMLSCCGTLSQANEDVHYVQCLVRKQLKIASVPQAEEFAFESYMPQSTLVPLGVHKAYDHAMNHTALRELCPEYKSLELWHTRKLI